MQIEDRLMALANHTDMGRPMIVRIDHGAEPAKSEGRQHIMTNNLSD